ncbi:HAMP domain-containing histidine kinase [Mucilaginibacter sp. RS28]|uniref:histidine kinase n=1 Tax=Mucilaginibacter straminoryzae TaxID=2932774 RepID=A0A9X1X682_9SPHI|nr:HAMP domain-containing sensor histidine kinase [Mucilaginibacter straminoryzae]MCJ8211085.1 HAMP domain-containing histidine kinase [Mucilaginibacter straminoryzae]
METYFLRSIPVKYRTGYRKYYMLQNLKAVQIAAVIFFTLNIVLRVFYFLLSEGVTHAQNFPEFNVTNWAYLALTPVFIIAANIQLASFKKNKKVSGGMSALVNLFAIYIIACGLASAIISTHDPRNSLILYLIALIFTGTVFLFEWEDTIMLTVVTEIIFTGVLFYCNLDATEMIYNQVMSVFLLAGFFFISRYVYSFRAAFYLQLVDIETKNAEIEKASAFKNDVLGMVAHDLRNPIGAIESIALIMELDNLDEDMEDNVNMIKSSCLKARSIINDLLEVARNEGNAELQTQKVELNELLSVIINEWNFRDEIKNHIVLESTRDEIYADINVEKFQRVIDNLISNALKFSKDADKVEVFLKQLSDGVQIEIKDYGLGIPEKMLPHIFERFSKAGRKGLRGELSTGLGLSIVRQIVEKHHGKIEVESQENKGSTFRINLPQAV